MKVENILGQKIIIVELEGDEKVNKYLESYNIIAKDEYEDNRYLLISKEIDKRSLYNERHYVIDECKKIINDSDCVAKLKALEIIKEISLSQ